MHQGRLVILSGPSGVGKDTLIEEWAKRDSRITRVISYTTRAPRLNEVDGIDYHFVDVDTFAGRVQKGLFLEHKEVYGNFYGTPADAVTHLLSEGRIAILKIDVQGALAVMPLRPDAITIFLMPPSEEELMRRITDRGTDSPEAVALRLKNAQEEIDSKVHYQHVVVNDDLQATVDKLQEIIRAAGA